MLRQASNGYISIKILRDAVAAFRKTSPISSTDLIKSQQGYRRSRGSGFCAPLRSFRRLRRRQPRHQRQPILDKML
jgi:hypothetical protein